MQNVRVAGKIPKMFCAQNRDAPTLQIWTYFKLFYVLFCDQFCSQYVICDVRYKKYRYNYNNVLMLDIKDVLCTNITNLDVFCSQSLIYDVRYKKIHDTQNLLCLNKQ